MSPEILTHDLTKFQSVPCKPYYFTNDDWLSGIVEQVAEQQAAPETANTTTLVCGPGGLPYLSGILRANNLIQVDIEESVLDFTQRRVDTLLESKNWDDCFVKMMEISEQHGFAQDTVAQEWINLRHAGIIVEETPEAFTSMRDRVEDMTIQPIAGDIIDPRVGYAIASVLKNSSSRLSMAHVTNVLDYIRRGHARGYEPLARVLAQLPTTAEFKVLYSHKDGACSLPLNFVNLESFEARHRLPSYSIDEYSRLDFEANGHPWALI